MDREIYEKAATYLEDLAKRKCHHWFFGCGICKGAKLLRKILNEEHGGQDG